MYIDEAKQVFGSAVADPDLRFRTLFELAPDGIYLHDLNGVFVDGNRMAEELVGYRREELIGRSFLDLGLLGEEDLARAAVRLFKNVQGEITGGEEFVLIRKDGTRLPVEIRSFPIVCDGRSLVLGIARDISERKKLEADVRLGQEQLNSFFSGATVGLALLDRELRYLKANQTLADVNGLPVKEHHGRRLQDVVPQIDPTVVAMLQRVLETGERILNSEVSCETQSAPGVKRDWLMSVVPVGRAGAKPDSLGIILVELTNLKRLDRERTRLARQFESLLDSTGEGILGIDVRGNCTFINRAGSALLGRVPDQVLGRNVHEVLQHRGADGTACDSERCPILAALVTGKSCRIDTDEFCRPDGRSTPVEFSARPIWEGGAIAGLVLTFADITERKWTEITLRRSHDQLRALASRLLRVRDEEQTRLAREIHDEFGQMLTALKMDLRCLERDLEENELHADHAKQSLERIVAVSSLVDQMVGTVQRIAADLRAGVVDQLGLSISLRHESRQFERRTGIVCRLRVPDSEPGLPLSAATACYRICQEALTNVARHAAATEVEIELRTEPGYWMLEVRDNGKGFSAEKLHGPSLGLLGMQERARQVGGNLLVESGLKRTGTVVRLSIPISS